MTEMNTSNPFPLTDVQRAYLMGRQAGQPLGGTGCHMTFEFDHGRAPDPERLDEAFRRLQMRHVSLRTSFAGLDHGVPLDQPPGRLAVHDLRQVRSGAVDAELGRIREEMAGQLLDVAAGRLMDLRLTLLPGGGARLHVDIDLLAADPPAIRVVLDDLVALYDGDLHSPAGDFAQYQREQKARAPLSGQGGHADRHESSTAPRLPYAVEPDELPVVPRFARREVVVRGPAWQRIKDRARAAGVRADSVPFAAFVATLQRWSEEQDSDFVLNLPVFGRPGDAPHHTCTVGDFSKLLAVTAPAARSGHLGDLARWADGARRTDAPTVTRLREAARSRGETAPALGVVYTALARSWVSSRFTDRFGAPAWMLSHTPQVWLDCLTYPASDAADDGIVMAWDAVEEVFLPGTLDGMTEYCGTVLDAFADADWDVSVPEQLPARQVATRRRVNDTRGPESGLLLHERFFQLAAERPERAALHHGDNTLTRGELAERALRLASHLRQLGLRDGEPVGISLTSGEAQVVSVLGVLAAGGAYVPVGPDQPEERREQVLRVADARFVIGEERQAGAADARPAGAPAQVPFDVALDPGLAPLARPVRTAPGAPAYVIFTSGSTGTPKGVEVSHRSAVNSLEDLNRRWGVGPDDCCLSVSALDFDLSVYEIFGPLMAGGRVVMPRGDQRRDPEAWLRLMREHHVTVWDSVPVLLDMLVTAGELGGAPSTLRVAFTGGDWIGTDLPGRLHRLVPECRFVACGGATEGAVYSNFHEVTEVDPDWPSVPYGTPLRNQCYRAVDAHGRDCPDWVSGELWIGGTGVALGYRGDPDRTAERFVEYDGMRWYRTGDLGRYRPDGVLEFLGRSDHQIKLNGYRIELGEIEGVLGSHPDVARAVAVLVGEGSGRRIVSYLMPSGDSLDLAAVRDHAGRRLPGYAQPDTCLLVPELPLSGNGKIDRKQLIGWAAPLREPTPQEPPLPGTERALAHEWAALLGRAPASRHDNFFDLGADSLLAMRLSLAVTERFGTKVPLRRLQSAATLVGMARAIDDAPDTGLKETS
ncbi:hypothetical protein GCM10009837_82140 [Streptomyces durmitorensis]|uniref:Amino acid adenylation domain-containing protein n=1 Tax=Streptomyces durmitorensis TaxID=319947 RepID=A0ABY4Q7W3_9ACTN|nr:amino acid adenylation domain-containing protein [Streptomyces durmitorensis]UQT61108.1 amino acid adenylation domain-containing protein [Streptomyces durmitorensis]